MTRLPLRLTLLALVALLASLVTPFAGIGAITGASAASYNTIAIDGSRCGGSH